MRIKRMLPPREPMLSTQEAADRLGISESFLNKARAAGSGPVAYVFGRRVKYRVSDVDAYAAAHRQDPIGFPSEGGEA